MLTALCQALREGCVHGLQAWSAQSAREHSIAEDRGRHQQEGDRLLPWQAMLLRLQGPQVSCTPMGSGRFVVGVNAVLDVS